MVVTSRLGIRRVCRLVFRRSIRLGFPVFVIRGEDSIFGYFVVAVAGMKKRKKKGRVLISLGWMTCCVLVEQL